MVLDWFSSPALFPPSISSSCWVCVFKLLCVFGRTHSLKRVCFSTVRAHSLDLIRFSISITRVYRHEFCIETNRFTCALLRLRCCVPCPAVAAAADAQMRVSSLCPCPGCCAGLMPSPASWTPRPLPQRMPRWSFGLGPASIGIGRRPAGQPRPGPAQGPAPCRSCLVRRWVRPGPAAKPAVECKAARARAPTTRAAPGQQPNCGWCHVRAWVPSLHRTCL